MIKKINVNSLYKIIQSNIFIMPIFSILSILSSVVFIKSHFIPNGADLLFHWDRIYELKLSIINGNFVPKVALNRVLQSGSAVMTMYPKINLYAIVFLSFLFKSFIHLYYVVFILRNFLALLIAYFSSLFFNHSKRTSFIFSLVYVLSGMMLNYSINVVDMGESSILLFLPLVIFGCLSFLRDKKWIEFSIGFSAIILCHVISIFIVLLFIFLFLLFNIKKICEKSYVISLLKVIITTILITSIFWIPSIVLYTNNQIDPPLNTSPMNGTNFLDLTSAIFNNSSQVNYITLFAAIGLLLGLICFKRLSQWSKEMIIIGILFIIICSPFVPWGMLDGTFINKALQFPTRLYVIPQMLFCYVFSESIVNFLNTRKRNVIAILTISSIVICSCVAGQKQIVDSYLNNHFNSQELINEDRFLSLDYLPSNYLKTDINYMFTNHEGLYGKHQSVKLSLMGNGKYSYDINKNVYNIKMPFLIYGGIDYDVKIDGKNEKFTSDNRSRLVINHLIKGKHTVQVIVHKSWYDYLSYVLSALGVIILAFAWIRSLIFKHRNK